MVHSSIATALLLLAQIDTGSAQTCTYTLSSDSLSWSGANAACQAAGLQLARVQSAAQNALLLSAMSGVGCWIGGTDSTSEGTSGCGSRPTPQFRTPTGPVASPVEVATRGTAWQFKGTAIGTTPTAPARRDTTASHAGLRLRRLRPRRVLRRRRPRRFLRLRPCRNPRPPPRRCSAAWRWAVHAAMCRLPPLTRMRP